MGRFAQRPEARFVAQDAQPGIVLGAAFGVSFEETLQPGDGFGAAVDVAQIAHQGELRIAGFGEARHREAADFEGDFVVSALAISFGEFQPYRDVVGLGGDFFAQGAQLVIAVAGIDGIADLPVPGVDGRGRRDGGVGTWV